MCYVNIDDLEYHFLSLSCLLNQNAFVITPVEFVLFNDACSDYSMSESNLHFENVIVQADAQQWTLY